MLTRSRARWSTTNERAIPEDPGDSDDSIYSDEEPEIGWSQLNNSSDDDPSDEDDDDHEYVQDANKNITSSTKIQSKQNFFLAKDKETK